MSDRKPPEFFIALAEHLAKYDSYDLLPDDLRLAFDQAVRDEPVALARSLIRRTGAAPAEIESICQERMAPYRERMEAMSAEFERVRKAADEKNYAAIAAAEVDRRVQEAQASVDQMVRERTKKEHQRAERYYSRALTAEKKLEALLEGELDPYEFLGTPDASQSPVPSADQ